MGTVVLQTLRSASSAVPEISFFSLQKYNRFSPREGDFGDGADRIGHISAEPSIR